MNYKKVVISCPIRNRDWIISDYLDHILKLDYPKKQITLLWVLNQSNDESEKILRKFKEDHKHEYRKIIIKVHNGKKVVPEYKRIQKTRKVIYNHLAEVRNFILNNIGDNDYIFSCDSDILLKPNTLNRLLEADKSIISSLIYNGYKYDENNAWRYPNILKIMSDGKIEHIANTHVKNAPLAKDPKLIKADITGACVLLSREVAEKVRYEYHIQGEDVAFSLNAKNKGYDIWCDVGMFNQHIMDLEMLDVYKKGDYL